MATPSSSSSTALIRSWRTSFLTLRDESLSSSSSTTQLLHDLIFSNSDSLIAASHFLPPPEVSSDVLFLLELVTPASDSVPDITMIFSDLIQLVHGISFQVALEFSSSSWVLLLESFGNVIQFLLGKVHIPGNCAQIRPIVESLEIVSRVCLKQRKFLPLEDIQLTQFLLSVISGSQSAILPCPIIKPGYSAEIVKSVPKCNSLWDVQAVAFNLLSQAITSLGSSFPVDIWKSTIQVVRKVMDFLASSGLLVEDKVMSRFYLSLLRCLHLVLTDPKCSLSDHVSAFVASLRMFFSYGFSITSPVTCTVGNQGKDHILTSSKSSLEGQQKTNHSAYRPPHLRRRENSNMKQANVQNSSLMAEDSQYSDFTSSDSDYDSDGKVRDTDIIQNAKVRVAAVICIQDLCQADPKAFTSQWTLLLPTRDVMLPRKFEATLMTCLLFDPSLKAQITSAATLVVMLDRTASIFLQIAEYKDPTKCGSFMPLSISLGLILMQLHTGVLYLIQRSTHGRLLTILFKILLHLISSTPYPRMPKDLLPTVIKTLQATIEEGLASKSDQTDLLGAAICCLNAALSTTQPSPHVREMFSKEISTAPRGSSVIVTLLKYSEQFTSPTVCFEALQALKAVSHSYPHIVFAFWEQVSSAVYSFLSEATPEVSTGQWRVHLKNRVGIIGEKVLTAAVKVLDECLRAISGFKGTEELLDDNLFDSPFTSDCIRMKKVSSAPSYELENINDTGDSHEACPGMMQWCEVLEKHLPRSLLHTSAMVRAASITCFAGITSSVFSSLSQEKKDYILSSVVNAALYDEVPSVRSAACRAIGVISCFPQVSQSVEILDKFIHAVEINARDSLVSVRVTASWALANICESMRRLFDGFLSGQSRDSIESSHILTLLIECTLRLANDGDKIKSNAVRALGNLSRLIKFSCLTSLHAKPVSSSGLYLMTNEADNLLSKSGSKLHLGCASENLYHTASSDNSSLLERIVQAFISGITTGNVKVQWNVCHALSNLFLNETLRLQDRDRVSPLFNILLLLLRDSSNFKVRIQAAAALSVPASADDYGKSFPDVVQGLEHTIENLESSHILAPSFKYKVALVNQLTSTMLHILSLASSTGYEPLKDFLVKKSTFLEEWFKALCSSLDVRSNLCDGEESTNNQKREMISKALQSLIEVYMSRNNSEIARKFVDLDKCIQSVTPFLL